MLAVLSPLVIKERTTSKEAMSVLVATVGVILVAHAGNGFRAFGLADLSALLAAFFVAQYSLVGRYLRTRVSAQLATPLTYTPLPHWLHYCLLEYLGNTPSDFMMRRMSSPFLV